jgi:O-antigen/teichoic acid export membrane protein
VVVSNFVIAAVAVGILVALGDWLLGMFGSGFEAGYVPLVILGAGVLARVAAGPVEDILNMTGYGGVSAWTYIGAVAANVIVALILIGPFGLNGAAFAAAAALVLKSLAMSIAVRRRLGIHTSIISAVSTWFGTVSSRSAHLRSPAE